MKTHHDNASETRAERKSPACGCGDTDGGRRTFLVGALALGVLPIRALASESAEEDPRRASPQPGDRLAYAVGDYKGEEVHPEHLQPGEDPKLVYPMDPVSGTLRDGSRANLSLVVRVDPHSISERMQPYAADGVVAYSALCTHNGCPVTALHESGSQVVCNCHGSVFNVADNGTVTTGPANRRLAALPVRLDGDALMVTGGFVGPVGIPRQ